MAEFYRTGPPSHSSIKPKFVPFKVKPSFVRPTTSTSAIGDSAEYHHVSKKYAGDCKTADVPHATRVNLDIDTADFITRLNASHREGEEADEERKGYNADIVAIQQEIKKLEGEEGMIEDTKAMKKEIAAKKKSIKALVKKLDSVQRKRDKIKVPYRVTIYIDNREGRNNSLFSVFDQLKYDIVVLDNLKACDFILCINNKLHAIIERKKLLDLVQSIQDSRLGKQTVNMIYLFPDLDGQSHRCINLLEKMKLQKDMKCVCEPVDELNLNDELERILTGINQQYALLQSLSVFDEEKRQVELKAKIQTSLELLNEYVQETKQSVKPASHETCKGDLMYLNTDENSFEGLPLDRSRIIGSVVNRNVLNGFSTITSESDKYTAYWLLKMMLAMQKNGEILMERYKHQPDFTLKRIKEAEDNLTGEPLKEWLDSRPLPFVKSDFLPIHFSPEQRKFVLQMRILDTVTIEYAILIVEKWQSPDNFADYLVSTEVQEVIDTLAALCPAKSGARKLGVARALKIYNHHFQSHYSANKKGQVVMTDDPMDESVEVDDEEEAELDE
jgi:ERCC4-type nuclease